MRIASTTKSVPGARRLFLKVPLRLTWRRRNVSQPNHQHLPTVAHYAIWTSTLERKGGRDTWFNKGAKTTPENDYFASYYVTTSVEQYNSGNFIVYDQEYLPQLLHEKTSGERSTFINYEQGRGSGHV